MEYVILGLLLITPLSIYDINKTFEQGISLFYSASLGSIQSAVKKLLEKEWIVFEELVDNGRNKKIYSITPFGIEAFFRWMHEPLPPNKLEVTLLSKVHFLGLVQSKEERRTIVDSMIATVEEVEQALSGQKGYLKGLEMPDAFKMIFHYQMKTLDYGIGAHQFGLSWLKGIRDELDTR